MKLISVGFKNHKILGKENEIMFFNNSRHYSGEYYVDIKYSSIDKGENSFTFLIGENGTGKSIFLKTIAYYLYFSDSFGSNKANRKEDIDLGLGLRTLDRGDKLLYKFLGLSHGFSTKEHILSDTNSQLIYLSGSPFENHALLPLPTSRFKTFTHDNQTHINKHFLLKALSREYFHDEFLALNSFIKAPDDWKLKVSLSSVVAGSSDDKLHILLKNVNNINIFNTIELFDNLAELPLSGKHSIFDATTRDLFERFIYNDYFFEFFHIHRHEHEFLFKKIRDSKIVRSLKGILNRALNVHKESHNITLKNESDSVLLQTSKIRDIDYFDIELLSLLEGLNIIDIQLTNGDKSIENFSSGEQVLIKLFSIFANMPDATKRDNLIFLYDEPENSLHPRWQKEFINIFRNVVEDIYNIRNSHFIFATHSPLIIQYAGINRSDNMSVIKLYKDEEGKTNGEKIEDIYAYNIEELLLDEFSIAYRNEDVLDHTYSMAKKIFLKERNADPLESVLDSFELMKRIEELLNDIEKNNEAH